MVNNSLDIQPAEYTDLNLCYTSHGYGQIIIDLDAIMVELQ
jgi:hypothetical protein